MTDLRAHIMKALEGTSGQNPVYIEALRKIAARHDVEPEALYAELDSLYAERQVNRCAGAKAGKPYLAYWLTGANTPPAPFSIVKKPRTHLLPRRDAPSETQPTQAAPAAAPAKEPAMPKQSANEALCAAMLKHIEMVPGLTGENLMQWVKKEHPGTDRGQFKHAIKTLNDRKAVTTTGKTRGLRYFVAGAVTWSSEKKAAPAKPAAPARKPQIAIASAELERATKAAQCADLLFSDMEALNTTSNPLVRELLSDLLPGAHQLKIKLARLAGHIQQLHSQGAQA